MLQPPASRASRLAPRSKRSVTTATLPSPTATRRSVAPSRRAGVEVDSRVEEERDPLDGIDLDRALRGLEHRRVLRRQRAQALCQGLGIASVQQTHQLADSRARRRRLELWRRRHTQPRMEIVARVLRILHRLESVRGIRTPRPLAQTTSGSSSVGGSRLSRSNGLTSPHAMRPTNPRRFSANTWWSRPFARRGKRPERGRGRLPDSARAR